MKKNRNILGFLYFFACFSLVLMIDAHAYLDPSATTYAIQVVAGIAVAVGATAGIYFRRAKKKVQETLGIEENKEVEDEIVVEEEDI